MTNENSENPLVSVGVLTYNSAKTVVETLESIKAQTYQNIELIISDDASKDDTVEVCQKWIDENKDRFVRCEILTVPENTGIPANANRRLMAAKGVWSKGIAADDALLPDCIENFINYTKTHPEAEVIFANVNRYQNTFEEKNYINTVDYDGKEFCEKYQTPQSQHAALIERFYCLPGTMLGKIEVLKKIKFDESIKYMEDYPMWLRLTKAGVRFYFMDKVVMNYRLSTSTFQDINDKRVKALFIYRQKGFNKKYICPNVSFARRTYIKFRYIKYTIFYKMGLLDKNGGASKYKLFLFLDAITTPQTILKKLKNKIMGK